MRVQFSTPTSDFYTAPSVNDLIRRTTDGTGVFLNSALAALHTVNGLQVEGSLRAETQHGGKISFTLSHHAMSETPRDWSAFEGRAI